MQQFSLRKEAKQYIKNNRHGDLKTRRFRNHVISKLTQDVYIIKNTPNEWLSFNNDHLKQLANHWRKQKIKPATMLNHLTVIRKFLNDIGNKQTTLTNRQLGIVRNFRKKKKIPVTQDFWQQIEDPLIRIILVLQVHFGLTYSEAIRIKPNIHTQQNNLWLTREITFNGQDRIVPYRNEIQTSIIDSLKELTQGPYSLLQVYGEQNLKARLRSSHNQLKLPKSKSWRYLYAKWLNQELSSALSQYKLNWVIMEELGVKSRTSLWRYLNEQ
ncbi:hypothetical protein [Legionella yabuuchiae]|uniref:hypothetical protein n=1 Tax=Legionella yabuuchiae TaxID=376727 RepID=UPI001054838D|nr:hypothetical protein [Legionella yabuuchiae]